MPAIAGNVIPAALAADFNLEIDKVCTGCQRPLLKRQRKQPVQIYLHHRSQLRQTGRVTGFVVVPAHNAAGVAIHLG